MRDYLEHIWNTVRDEPSPPSHPQGTHSLIIVWNWFWYAICVALFILAGFLKVVVGFFVWGILPIGLFYYLLINIF